MTFSKLGLSEKLVQLIEQKGFNTPTPVQGKTIPSILAGLDIFACAQTGTGKTGAFLLPIIDYLAHTPPRTRLPRAIILEPTRELAIQIQENFKTFSAHTSLKSSLLMGGEFFGTQDKLLAKGVDVVIATPGRLIDTIERGKVLLHGIDFFVIDEADRMLDMGFMPDVEKLLSLLPSSKQTLLFSATVSPAIQSLAATFLKTPKTITASERNSSAATIEQFYVETSPADKRKVLRDLIHQINPQKLIVFCNRKTEVDLVVKSLSSHGFKAEGIHGDIIQSKRNDAITNYKNKTFKYLVASDVAARGLDIDQVDLVVNYDLPTNIEDYVHRIGRTGRAGNKGVAITLVTKHDQRKLKSIQKLINLTLQAYPLKQIQTEVPPQPKGPSQPKGPIIGFGLEIPAFMKIEFSY